MFLLKNTFFVIYRDVGMAVAVPTSAGDSSAGGRVVASLENQLRRWHCEFPQGLYIRIGFITSRVEPLTFPLSAE